MIWGLESELEGPGKPVLRADMEKMSTQENRNLDIMARMGTPVWLRVQTTRARG